MAKEVIMPKFGFTQETAELLRWLKQPGDFVEQGDPIAEVTTDKVDMEVEAPATGVLAELRFRPGDVVPVTTVIAVILEKGEAQSAGPDVGEQRTENRERRTPSDPGEQGVVATPVAARVAQEHGVELGRIGGTGPGGRITRRDVETHLAAIPPSETAAPSNRVPGNVAAVPAARKLARSLGIDLAAVQGSGPRGRIQSIDVAAAGARPAQAPPQGISPSAEQSLPAGVTRTIPLVGMRRTIAQRLQQSYQQAPHITFDVDVDMSAVEALRHHARAINDDNTPPPSLSAVLVRAIAWALRRQPLLNSRLLDDRIEVLAEVHIGVAVALEEGLIVPVVRDADRKGILQIAAEVADLAARARGGKLRPDDVAGGTFTLSNLGMYGVDRFTAILNPPQVGILAAGQIRRQFVPDEQDRPVARPVLSLRLSADHRAVDGAVAARFLSDLRAVLEQPGLLSL